MKQFSATKPSPRFESDDEKHPKFIECRNDFDRLLERESLGS
jgi:hypothetical protein